MPGILSILVYWPSVEPENHYQVYTRHRHFCCLAVLGLVGMELVFFITACRVLCFSFVTKAVLTAHQCFSYCRTVLAHIKNFSVSHSAPPASRLRVGKRLGRDTARTADPNQPKRYSIPHNIMLSNNTWGWEGEESFQSNCCSQRVSLAWCCDKFFGLAQAAFSVLLHYVFAFMTSSMSHKQSFVDLNAPGTLKRKTKQNKPL